MLLWMLVGCGNPCLPTVGVPMVVCTVDEVGPVAAEKVVWYWPPEEGAYDGDHEAECANDDCSVWFLREPSEGSIYISGTAPGPEHDTPGCTWTYADERRVKLESEQRQVMDLVLELTESCE